MNYEQKYKGALERAKNYYNSIFVNNDILEDIFPELKESEDERIRKALIAILKSDFETDTTIYDISVGEIIDWLEKQCKHPENFDEAEKEKSDFVGGGFIECHANFLDFKEGETYWLEYIGDDKYNVRSDNLLGKTYHITPCQLYTIFKKLTWLEKQGEQKTVEPKFNFKVGDWITDGYLHCKISDVLDDRYIVDTKFAKRSFILFRCEHNYHLWTIEDAKDGDVIYEKSTESIILFKSENCGWIDSHCSYWQKTKTFECGKRQYGRVSEMNICPATKEQRERFFAAMGDADYEWDAEKKQVIKL